MADAGDARDRQIPLEALDPLSFDEALSVLGESTRARIVFELGRASVDAVTPSPLSFSELMDRVGVEDSGRFNYHLNLLVDTFVRKTDEGYLLRLPGRRIYQGIVAGTVTERVTIEPVPVGDCPECDGTLSAAYSADHVLAVECEDCGLPMDAIHLPPRAVEVGETEALLAIGYQRRFHTLSSLRRGICHGCGGWVGRALVPPDDPGVPASCVCPVIATLECSACGSSAFGNPAVVALTTPAVVGFFDRHDRDPALVLGWEEPLASARDGVETVDDGEGSVMVTFRFETEALQVTLDDDIQVVETDITPHERS